jgi:hypothetical protein
MGISNEKYNRMSDVFDADFEPEDEELNNNVPVRSREEIQQELIKKTAGQNEMVQYEEPQIQDQNYIQNELRIGVELLGDVAETVRSDLGQGASGSKIESFASIMKERREHLNALKDINVKVKEMNNKEEPTVGDGSTKVQNNMIFTSTDALDLILQARDGLDPNKEL